MNANDRTGQESPDRPTHRLCTDGGTTTVYRTTGRHDRDRDVHTDRDCPYLAKARRVRAVEVEAIDADELCSWCSDDEEWNQSDDDDDWGYQRALAEAAGVDGKIVTDGGVEEVLVPTVDRSELHYHRERMAGVPICGPLANNYERRSRDTAAEYAEPCERCFGSDLRADGGTLTACPECDSPRIKRRSPQKPDSPSHQTKRWACLECAAHFDEPVERAPKRGGTGLSGTAADLFEAETDALPDGGARLRSKADANTGELSAAGVVGWPTQTEAYVDLGDRLDDELPAPDRSEHERRARQTATSLVAWSRRAGVDPAAVLDEVRAGLPRADGGEEQHYCEICERPFETIARLIKHDCAERDAPLVTDGGKDRHPLDALLGADEDDHPETLALGDTEVATDEFMSRLSVIQGVALKLENLQSDLEALRETGLRDDDVVNLLYGRNAGLNKRLIESVMETVDDLDRRLDTPSAREDLLVRLTTDLSDSTLSETETVFDELAQLNQRYGGDDE